MNNFKKSGKILKVRDLMKYLQKCSPDAEIHIWSEYPTDFNDYDQQENFIEQIEYSGNEVWLSTFKD